MLSYFIKDSHKTLIIMNRFISVNLHFIVQLPAVGKIVIFDCIMRIKIVAV